MLNFTICFTICLNVIGQTPLVETSAPVKMLTKLLLLLYFVSAESLLKAPSVNNNNIICGTYIAHVSTN